MTQISRAVLVTGCSSGIGRATALRLAAGGWSVWASARRLDAIADLADAGCRTLALDVTDEASMEAAVARVRDEAGAVGVLVNNAGYSQSGAVETVPLEAARRQFETNLFGLARLTQLVVPGMRAQRWGKVVNIGSMGGRLTFPGGGWYHATKYALEALSDALRFELRGFGVDVILVEPGLITTGFASAANTALAGAGLEATGAADDRAGATAGDGAGATDDPYARFNATVGAVTKGAYEGPLRVFGGGPDRVAKAIEKAIARDRAPSRVVVTPSARATISLRSALPDRAWDALMRRQFPTPGA
ncbi:SDR family NAD(P)-dependent oxidoreductase [Conexibacter arvalis]|uniref:NAD(P)-dependent dehydrogenase (Short-subunit alcohol dehydrogenase family) n=1 Tax=Conexibacter arvalis TaxID=912552 RepID=A0A840IEP3_9ACTN|nr:SDR family NAD(P)-dependent oxidoreductase [Conexibacter arvalis]MBB4663286.1 NAD(P)-dependent dehydrogenase (short-subunit alcohol dehydrogenase family) [Conexibacter arvalis]